MQHNTIKGKKYNLTPFTVKDISEEYISWLNNPNVNKFLEVRHCKQTLKTATEYVTGFYETREKYIWGIYTLEDKLIGTISLYDIDYFHKVAELGMMIGDTNYWGKSASDESLGLVINFAFSNLGLNRVIGGSYSTNMGMNFTYKKLGFSLEGVLRKNFLSINEEYVDGYRWGLLAEEWK